MMHGPINIENQCTYLIISRSVLLRMRNVRDKICRENQITFCVNNFFYAHSAVYEIIWQNIVEP